MTAFQRACGRCEQAGGAARILIPESPGGKALFPAALSRPGTCGGVIRRALSEAYEQVAVKETWKTGWYRGNR